MWGGWWMVGWGVQGQLNLHFMCAAVVEFHLRAGDHLTRFL